jgi:hypothetical protein
VTQPILFLLVTLATYRLTELPVEDLFPPTRRVVDWLIDHKPDGSLAYLLQCNYCVSVWASAIVTFLTWFAVRNTVGMTCPVLWWAAAAGLASIIFRQVKER